MSFLEFVQNSYGAASAALGGISNCAGVTLDELNQVDCVANAKFNGNRADATRFSYFTEELVLNDMASEAHAGASCLLPLVRGFSPDSVPKPSKEAEDAAAKLTVQVQDSFNKIAPTLRSQAASMEKLREDLTINLRVCGEKPSALCTQPIRDSFSKQIASLTVEIAKTTSKLPFGTSPSVRDALYDYAISGKQDAASFKTAFTGAMKEFGTELGKFKTSLDRGKQDLGGNAYFYNSELMPSVRRDLMSSDQYNDWMKAKGVSPSAASKLLCRRDAEFKKGPARARIGLAVIGILSLGGMAVGAGAAVASGEGALMFAAEGAAAANARLQLGLLGVDLAASGINLVSSCPPSKTYTNLPAKCSIEDALNIVERGPSRAECYSAAGATALAVAPVAVSAALVAKRALAPAIDLKNSSEVARAVGRISDDAPPLRAINLTNPVDTVTPAEAAAMKQSADAFAARITTKSELAEGLGRARIKSQLVKLTRGDLHSSTLAERQAANQVANDLSQSMVDQLARQGIRVRRERSIVNAAALKKSISRRQAKIINLKREQANPATSRSRAKEIGTEIAAELDVIKSYKYDIEFAAEAPFTRVVIEDSDHALLKGIARQSSVRDLVFDLEEKQRFSQGAGAFMPSTKEVFLPIESILSGKPDLLSEALLHEIHHATVESKRMEGRRLPYFVNVESNDTGHALTEVPGYEHYFNFDELPAYRKSIKYASRGLAPTVLVTDEGAVALTQQQTAVNRLKQFISSTGAAKGLVGEVRETLSMRSAVDSIEVVQQGKVSVVKIPLYREGEEAGTMSVTVTDIKPGDTKEVILAKTKTYLDEVEGMVDHYQGLLKR